MAINFPEFMNSRRKLGGIDLATTGPYLNLASGNNVLPGFDNVDLFEGGEVIPIDLFEIPWDLPSDHYKYILASHILEHVPHQINGLKGEFFFHFLGEIIRVAKDGAILEVHVPHGNPTRSLCQAGHTRLVTPRTFWAWTKKPGRIRRSREANQASEMCDMKVLRKTYRRAFAIPKFPITDYHFRKYIGVELGIAIHLVLVFKISKGKNIS